MTFWLYSCKCSVWWQACLNGAFYNHTQLFQIHGVCRMFGLMHESRAQSVCAWRDWIFFLNKSSWHFVSKLICFSKKLAEYFLYFVLFTDLQCSEKRRRNRKYSWISSPLLHKAPGLGDSPWQDQRGSLFEALYPRSCVWVPCHLAEDFCLPVPRRVSPGGHHVIRSKKWPSQHFCRFHWTNDAER